MAHTRIRKFNTKETYPEQNLDNDLCQALARPEWLAEIDGTAVIPKDELGPTP
jgi:hypothetical protein